MEIVIKEFNQRDNDTGSLSFLEASREIPFEIKRVYYLYGVKPEARRGFHAHKALQQYLICVYGRCKVLMDDGSTKDTVLLEDPNKGLYVGAGMWHEMYDFAPGSVLLVLASDYYDESDYMRDYNEFLEYVRGDKK